MHFGGRGDGEEVEARGRVKGRRERWMGQSKMYVDRRLGG